MSRKEKFKRLILTPSHIDRQRKTKGKVRERRVSALQTSAEEMSALKKVCWQPDETGAKAGFTFAQLRSEPDL